MHMDVFPNINIRGDVVVWGLAGLSREHRANRLVSPSERAMTTTVNDIEHIESQSFNGVAIIKVFFQPRVNIASSVAQVTSVSQGILRQLPPGSNPPFIIQYNASSVPVLQLRLARQGLDEHQLFDLGQNTIRSQIATV